MKIKFVKVWDNFKFGYVKFIILQVEECDKFLTESNFNPGYKFIIQAIYNRVGASGGYKFNPYYFEEKVKDSSVAINSTEAEVLGFYLNNIDDVHEIPNDLYTDNMWKVLYTSMDFEDQTEDNYDASICYKVLLINNDTTFRKDLDFLIDFLEEDNQRNSDIFKEANLITFKESLLRDKEKYKDTLDEPIRRIKMLIVNKRDFKIVDSYSSITSPNDAIARYLWHESEEFPSILFEKLNEVNEEELYGKRLFDFNLD